MSYQIKTILIDLQSIYNGTKKQELKTYLESVFNNLEPLQTKLEEFSAGP
jgi:tetrahydromethanopterin S-methyltransferase subunit B